MVNKGKTRYGKPADMARLDFHNWYGQLQDRIKAKTIDKDKGVLMIEKIQSYFGISTEHFRRRIIELNMEALTPTEVPPEMKKKQIKWTRDEKGKIVSPFKSK